MIRLVCEVVETVSVPAVPVLADQVMAQVAVIWTGHWPVLLVRSGSDCQEYVQPQVVYVAPVAHHRGHAL